MQEILLVQLKHQLCYLISLFNSFLTKNGCFDPSVFKTKRIQPQSIVYIVGLLHTGVTFWTMSFFCTAVTALHAVYAKNPKLLFWPPLSKSGSGTGALSVNWGDTGVHIGKGDNGGSDGIEQLGVAHACRRQFGDTMHCNLQHTRLQRTPPTGLQIRPIGHWGCDQGLWKWIAWLCTRACIWACTHGAFKWKWIHNFAQ